MIACVARIQVNGAPLKDTRPHYKDYKDYKDLTFSLLAACWPISIIKSPHKGLMNNKHTYPRITHFQ